MTAILPDFTPHGYRTLEQLNQNLQGGRITYKAIDLSDERPVIIKQFRFVTSRDWTAYKQVEREIAVLRDLNHEGIPRFLTSFDPGDGICLVQEYKDAPDLSRRRSFAPEEIKEIASQLLSILVYLQERVPLIVHRDIKPENVLVDGSAVLPKVDRLKVYLVDFGFARIGTGITALSSSIAGTTGFMPPEQLLNRTLTEASDLYGLGATLICLVTGRNSVELGDLVDHGFRIDFTSLASRYSLSFVRWLERMVDPDLQKRFQNAREALKALQPIDLIRVPEIKIDRLELEFNSTRVGEKLTQTIRVKNDVPDTMLEGKWSVSPHPSDPPHTPDDHAWIRFDPKEFRGNNIETRVTIDTARLRSDKHYEREIVLESNARQEKYYLKIKARTARLSSAIESKLPTIPYKELLITIVSLVFISVALIKGFPLIFSWTTKLLLLVLHLSNSFSEWIMKSDENVFVGLFKSFLLMIVASLIFGIPAVLFIAWVYNIINYDNYPGED